MKGLLVFEPVPFVARVVFIATPHRGSPIADGPVGWAVSRLMRRPMEQARAHRRDRSPERTERAHAGAAERPALNAISSLRTDSPILAALDRIPIDPRVPFHSIIPRLREDAGTDGVVALFQLAFKRCGIGEDCHGRSLVSGNPGGYPRDQADSCRTPRGLRSQGGRSRRGNRRNRRRSPHAVRALIVIPRSARRGR